MAVGLAGLQPQFFEDKGISATANPVQQLR